MKWDIPIDLLTLMDGWGTIRQDEDIINIYSVEDALRWHDPEANGDTLIFGVDIQCRAYGLHRDGRIIRIAWTRVSAPFKVFETVASSFDEWFADKRQE